MKYVRENLNLVVHYMVPVSNRPQGGARISHRVREVVGSALSNPVAREIYRLGWKK